VLIDIVKLMLTLLSTCYLHVCYLCCSADVSSTSFEAPAEFLDQLNQDVADIDLI
jgi:hypothetical protein